MEVGDIKTIKLYKNKNNGSFLKVIDKDWLMFMGFTEKEFEADSITLVVKAEISEHKKFRYIGIGRPEARK